MGTLTTFNFHDINFIGVSNVCELTYADRLETDTPSVIYVVHFLAIFGVLLKLRKPN